MKLKPYKVPEQSEAQITKGIRGVLKFLGIWHFKLHQGLGSTPGIPDIVGIFEGKPLYIEVKTRKGKLSDVQEQKIKEIQKAGGIAFVARSIDEVIDNLNVRSRFLC
jgi:hypothetical protein